MIEILSREKLLEILDAIMSPKGKGFSSEQIDKMLLTFCANCPDPVGAMRLIVECMDPMTNDELIDRAFEMPFRSVGDIPTTELSADHPLRVMAR